MHIPINTVQWMNRQIPANLSIRIVNCGTIARKAFTPNAENRICCMQTMYVGSKTYKIYQIHNTEMVSDQCYVMLSRAHKHTHTHSHSHMEIVWKNLKRTMSISSALTHQLHRWMLGTLGKATNLFEKVLFRFAHNDMNKHNCQHTDREIIWTV